MLTVMIRCKSPRQSQSTAGSPSKFPAFSAAAHANLSREIGIRSANRSIIGFNGFALRNGRLAHKRMTVLLQNETRVLTLPPRASYKRNAFAASRVAKEERTHRRPKTRQQRKEAFLFYFDVCFSFICAVRSEGLLRRATTTTETATTSTITTRKKQLEGS